MSRVTAIISAWRFCIIVWLVRLLIITADNAITYKAYKNARELKLANAVITGHADASA